MPLIAQRLTTLLLACCATFAALGDARAHAEPEAPAFPPLAATEAPSSVPAVAPQVEQTLLANIRQLTLVGKRAGEGYFSANGSLMIFQSERQGDNPFYQMYVVNRDTGELFRVSPGVGKTTCGWISPVEDKMLFASTHHDPKAREKQEAEFAARAAGTARPYAWDFDDQYEIYAADMASGRYVNLTNAPGYDAEASYSPDGRHILFASNRDAYTRQLTAEEQQQLQKDPSYFMDLYIMDADGSNLRRLTDAPGYDGGPCFSADGRRIVWRRFSEDGRSSEIFTMNADGTGQQQVTKMGEMAWAPFFHPSGDYIVYTSNRFGHDNFELFIIDSEGRQLPVRVTDSAGFDGLPTFTPDGHGIAWTSKRSADGSAQIFMASWDDAKARSLLGLKPNESASREQNPVCGACQARINHLRWHVATLAAEDMQGRLTGSEGEQRATQYVADVFKLLGLEPAGDSGTWFQSFPFTAGVSLGANNRLTVAGAGEDAAPKADSDWRPLSFTNVGDFASAPVIFAGYGIEAPAGKDQQAYDSYANADVSGKWVLVFRGMPADVAPARRLHLSRYAEDPYKAATARSKGAAGIIFAPAPGIVYKDELVRLSSDPVGGKSTIAALSVSRKLYERMTAPLGNGFAEVLKALDTGDRMRATDIPGLSLAATLDIVHEMKHGRNVLGRLRLGARPELPPLLVGAHVDHLGRGEASGSLAREEEKGQVHYGADDNASGVAALLDIAETLSNHTAKGALKAERDVVFAVWSGEELGLIGSEHYASTLAKTAGSDDLSTQIAAYLNMDMIGRLGERLTLFGTGTSTVWPHIVERANFLSGLMLELVDDGTVSSDATSFYLKGVPVLHAHTGPHEDYSTPRDTADRVNYNGLAKITTLMDGIARQLLASSRAPDFLRVAGVPKDSPRRRSGLFIGTIPDYASAASDGVKLSGVVRDGPAEKAGMKSGDVIVGINGMPIANIYDYVRALNMLKPGEAAAIAVLREGNRSDLSVLPLVRE